jgi:hypothetical protein
MTLPSWLPIILAALIVFASGYGYILWAEWRDRRRDAKYKAWLDRQGQMSRRDRDPAVRWVQ